MMQRIFAVALCLTTALSNAATFTPLGDLPGGSFNSNAQAVSADGSIVVGFGVNASGAAPFVWQSSTGMVVVGGLPGGNGVGIARDVSDDGSVIVGYSASALGAEPFRWTSAGGMVGLGDLPGGNFNGEAQAVSPDGSVTVGRVSTEFGLDAFRWTSSDSMISLGQFTTHTALDASAGGAVIVGNNGVNGKAFRWTEATGAVSLGVLPGAIPDRSGANSITPDGSVIVGWSNTSIGREAFRWTSAGGMVGLGDLPGGVVASVATAVSADGSVIVGQGTNLNGSVGFIWTEDGGMQSLTKYLTRNGASIAGYRIHGAMDVSADGTWIVGWAVNPDGFDEAFIARTIDPPIDVTVDINPKSTSNKINLSKNGVLTVAILTTSTSQNESLDFDATQIDPLSVELGHRSAHEIHQRGHVNDVDKDGDPDLVLHFEVTETGIDCSSSELQLSGLTYAKEEITGVDAITTSHCE